jgi:uncharacterized protein (DUF58 family)
MERDGRAYRTFLCTALPVAAVFGAATGASAAVGVALGGFALLLWCFLLSRRAPIGLTLRRELYPSGFEDDAVQVFCTLENRSRRPRALVRVLDAFGAGVAERQVMLEPGPLGARRRRRLAYRTFCSRPWGEYRVGPLALTVADPLGLFPVTRVFPELATFTVFPRVHEVAALEQLGSRASLTQQAATLGRAGQSLTYLGVRDHRPGDDVRRIHWPASARRGRLAVKEYEVDLLPYFTLLLDLHRGARAGTGKRSTLEYVVRTAACVVWAASKRGDVVQLIGEGAQPLFVPPGSGPLHATTCLYELVRARQEGRSDFFEMIARHAASVPERSTAALLCAGLSFDDAAARETLEALRARAVRPLVLVVNDASFAPVDRWPLTPERMRARCEEIRALLAECGAPGAILGADDDLLRELGRPDLFGDLS